MRHPYSVEDDLRSHISELERKLDTASREIELLTDERNMAVYERDEARAQHELHHGGPR